MINLIKTVIRTICEIVFVWSCVLMLANPRQLPFYAALACIAVFSFIATGKPPRNTD